jgi:hypothetical protein
MRIVIKPSNVLLLAQLPSGIGSPVSAAMAHWSALKVRHLI